MPSDFRWESFGSRFPLCRRKVFFLTSRKSGGNQSGKNNSIPAPPAIRSLPNSFSSHFFYRCNSNIFKLKLSRWLNSYRRKFIYVQILHSGLIRQYLIVLVLLWTPAKILRIHSIFLSVNLSYSIKVKVPALVYSSEMLCVHRGNSLSF